MISWRIEDPPKNHLLTNVTDFRYLRKALIDLIAYLKVYLRRRVGEWL
jgi:hypothetical protein